MRASSSGRWTSRTFDFIDGLSPAVSIDQKAASRNPRSTVGTITEVYDYLRLLYARIGKPHCPVCGRPIARQSPQQIVDRLLELEDGTRFQVLAPVVRGRKGEYGELMRELQTKGFSRARVDGVVVRLEEAVVGPASGAEEVREARHRGRDRQAGRQARGPAQADGLGRDRADAVRRSGRARLRGSAGRRSAPGADVLRAPGLPVRRPVVRRAGAAVVLVQLPVGRVPGLHRAGHQDGGRPRAHRARPGAVAGRRRDSTLGRRAYQRLLHQADRGAGRRDGVHPQHSVGEAPGRRPQGPAVRV